MNDLAKILYEKFFMRDLLGKILPGLIVSFAILSILGITDISSIVPIKEIQPLLWILALAWGVLAGLALQICGEFIGLHSASPRPNWLLLFPAKGNWKKVNEDFRDRFSLLRNANDKQWASDAEAQRERYVYLKEGSGNLSLALLVVFITLIVNGKPFWPLPLVVLIFALILYRSHMIHAKRQASFEITTLQKSGLLKDSEAEEMRKRVRLS